MENNKRYVAHIVMEALSPLKVGSSDVDMLQDSPVQKDWNGLPMILGTSIAGVLRKSYDKQYVNDIFGDENSKKTDAKGSRLIISNALLCNENMQVHEGLGLTVSDFLQNYETLPIREHVRMTDKGVADTENSGKFDEEIVYKGSRFLLRLELMGAQKDEEQWKMLLQHLHTNTFRIGGGTTKGFGEMGIVTSLCSYEVFDMPSKAYAAVSSSLESTYALPFPHSDSVVLDKQYHAYMLKLEPEDFFMFGAGFGDDDAGQVAVKEKVVVWKDNNGSFSDEQILMPASSLKGILSHRTAYYYNKIMMQNDSNYVCQVAEANKAVNALFGEAKESNVDIGSKGKVLFSDVYQVDKNMEKVFDHVSIDRFTGGAIGGMLFNEKTLAQKDMWEIHILLHKEVDSEYVKAFELALKDIGSGMLSLGGTTNKGHGVFTGEVLKNGGAL